MQLTTYPVPAIALGTTGIETTRIGMGCAGWPSGIELPSIIDALHAAFSIGVRHLDLAAKYDTEQTIGAALREMDRPDDLVYATKVCCYFDADLGHPYSSVRPEAAEASVLRSLRLLDRERLDIVYLHDIRREDLPALLETGGALSVLERMKEQGLVRAIGIAALNPGVVREILLTGRIDVVQSFHLATLLNRTAVDDLFELAAARGIPVLNAGPYAGHVLATGAREGAKYNYRPAPGRVMDTVRRLERFCRERDISLPEAAVEYSVRIPTVHVTVVGSGKPHHIRTWAAPFSSPLGEEVIEEMLDIVGPSIPVR